MSSTIPPLPLAIMALCAAVAWTVRKIPQTAGTFVHGAAWQVGSSFLLGLAPAVAHWAQQGEITRQSFTLAGLSFVLVFFSQDNPSATPQMRASFRQAKPPKTPSPGPRVIALLPLLPLLLISSFILSACTFAQFKQDLAIAGVQCGAKFLNDVMTAIDGGADAVIADVVAAVEDAACVYGAIGSAAARNGGALTSAQQANAAKLLKTVKRKLGPKMGKVPADVRQLLAAR